MSRTEQTEIERKYDVGADATVPDLTGADVGDALVVDRVETAGAVLLNAVYFDTADHVLLANRVTLRRRTGGGDEGWHLKLPPTAASAGRREVHWPLGGDSAEPVPAELRRLVEFVLRGRPLHPVLVLETSRTTSRLLAFDDTALAEIADDVVTAGDPDSAQLRAWREWEVELAPGIDGPQGEAVLTAVGSALERAGATPSESKSKLARGLGAGQPTPAGGALTPEIVPPKAKKKSAARFVRTAVADLTAELAVVDPRVRDDDPDSIHRFRVVVRRLRSVLRTYSGVLDADLSRQVVEGLAEIGHVAGAARDAEVAQTRLAVTAAGAPDGFVSVQTRGRLDAHLREVYRERSSDVRRALSSRLYFDVLDALDALAVAPLGARAHESAADFVASRLKKERRRTVGRRDAALGAVQALVSDRADEPRPSRRQEAETVTAEETTHLLHEARKAAKRYRYAAEAWSRVDGSKSKAARSAKHLQSVLGEYRDASAAVDLVRSVAEMAEHADEPTFGYGVLATLEHRAAEEALVAFSTQARSL
ncbi:CHAD domain-containing protein [Frigoribacterium sp. 2-23]|uniref:CYTH and CHAD domain-containing protein n=1 Tax=Frigoribacterium sp. 2-23 TaxID=3415006 RepID=UPI003C6FE883